MSSANQAVFLSYASQDANTARKICDALRTAGVEVWFDQNELRGGDQWDAKIRRQIRECALFVPVISSATEARPEGYFRFEWKLAVDRSHLMADDQPFLLPIIIDEVPESTARVPDRFREVQWTRIKLEETPTEFGSRVQALLAGQGRPDLRAERRAAERGERKRQYSRTGFMRWWWVPLPFCGVAIALINAFKHSGEPARHDANSTSARIESASSSGPVSEARKLVARARALYEPWDGATRDDFALAGQLLKKALEVDPTDAEIWAAQGVQACGSIVLGHDTSAAQFDLAGRASDRAIKLAPESNQARLARALFLRLRPETQKEAEEILLDLSKRVPDDGFVLHALGALLRSLRRTDESIEVLDRAAKLPGGGPLAHYNKFLLLSNALRYEEAEAAVDDGLAQHPTPYLYRAKVTCLAVYHGNLDKAAEVLAKVAPEYLMEDSGAYWASQIWLWRREPDKSLEVLRAFQRELIESNEFRGPKGFLAGESHRIAGRPAAAQAEWAAGLRAVERRLAEEPNSLNWIYWRSRLLACLGQLQEAEQVLDTLEQLYGSSNLTERLAALHLRLGRKDRVLEWIEEKYRFVESQNNPILRATFVNQLRFNPEWDLIRDEPRIQKLMLASN
jgi:tetratricopeptide (TPR) repeat protein